MTTITKDEFIAKEVATWGEDYIFDLIDRGYEAVELVDEMGGTKWSWYQRRLTITSECATMNYGGTAALLPFRRYARS